MTGQEHAVRNSLPDKERSYTLGPDALLWREDGQQGQLGYDDIRDVRLISYPSTTGTVFQCTVRGRKGGKVNIRSHHYQSLGQFEDRTSTYTPFIREFVRRVAARAPDAKFLAGSTALWVVWMAVAVLCILVFSVLITALFQGGPMMATIFAIICIVLLGATIVWQQIRKGSAAAFNPMAPPAELIGSPGTDD